MKSTFFILLTALTLTSCGADKRVSSNPNNNVFQVDADFCAEMKLPEVAFSIEYPKNLHAEPATPGNGNFNYINLYKTDKQGVQTEAVSFGYYQPTAGQGIVAEGLKRILLGQVLETYSEYFAIKDFDIKNFFFGGKRYLMLRAEGHGPDNSDTPEYKGDYILQSVLITSPNDAENGLIVTFFANENSPCKTFNDFATKGEVGKVWKSLKFE